MKYMFLPKMSSFLYFLIIVMLAVFWITLPLVGKFFHLPKDSIIFY